MVKSILAGIVDKNGGVRVVVTAPENIACHLSDGEQLFIVPDVLLDQPIAYESYPRLVQTAMRYVTSQRG